MMTSNSHRRRGAPRRANFPLEIGFRRAMFVLPNLFTLSSVFCGFYAIIIVAHSTSPQTLYRAGLAVFFGIFFDMADGRVARLTKTQSSFGMQLDSLADVITFGVTPALIVYSWGLSETGILGALTGFVFLACGALRLARFNVMAEKIPGPMKYFIGAPIPLAAGVIVSWVMFHQQTYQTHPQHPGSIAATVLLVAYLMVSNVRYRTFKSARLTTQNLVIALTLLGLFVITAVLIRPSFALMSYFWGYLVLGLIEEIIFYRRRRREEQLVSKPVVSHLEPTNHNESPP